MVNFKGYKAITMGLGAFLYRGFQRLIPLDFTYVFILIPQTQITSLLSSPKVISNNAVSTKAASTNRDAISCRVLSVEDLRSLSSDSDFAISPQFLIDANEFNIQCVGVSVNNHVVGLCCFALGEVPGRLNSGGAKFKGIGLQLPTDSCYLFKVIVKPKHRGKRLVAAMLQYALTGEDDTEPNITTEAGTAAGTAANIEVNTNSVVNGRSIVTTSDITNTAFKNAVQRLGFETVGQAGEAVILGKHVYKLPAPIYISATDSPASAQPVVFVKYPS